MSGRGGNLSTILDLLDLMEDSDPQPDVTGMVHRGDPHTSVDAAAVVARGLTELHERVLEAFRRYGPMTDEALEELPEFSSYGPSTIRKRRSELFHGKRLFIRGETRNRRGRKMLIWSL